MKLSELMRKGSKVVTQAYDTYGFISSETEIIACAIGATCYAAEGIIPSDMDKPGAVLSIFRATGVNISEAMAVPPEALQKSIDWNEKGYLRPSSAERATLSEIIVCLNDWLLWPIERIADYLEGAGY